VRRSPPLVQKRGASHPRSAGVQDSPHSADCEVLVHAGLVVLADVADQDVVTGLERPLERLRGAALDLDFAEAACLGGAAVLELQLGGLGRRLDNYDVVTPSGGFGLEAGLSAGVDTAGAIDKRSTATRLVLMGPFVLALRKKKDERELFLYVDAPTGQHVESCDPKEQARVRTFAAQITTAARRA
jgi:hypothetical protein